jgi:integrase
MLLFTGCRKGEILRLRWDEVSDNTLSLIDSKTGARTVWLGDEAQGVLARQSHWRGRSEFVFPCPWDGKRPFENIYVFWRGLKKEARLDDVRLHDLRHSFASEAVRQGIPLPVISKLLGHSSLTMTMRYTHLSTADIEAAAERIGNIIIEQMGG